MKKVAIITGGIRSIGLGIAEAFLKEGYRLVLNYRSDDQKAQNTLSSLNSKDVITVKADVTDAKDRKGLLKETLEQFGRFDILINSAGIIRMGRFLEVKSGDFEDVMDCNFYAPLYLSQLFANELVSKEQTGSIINILTIGAHGSGNIAYCTSKAALLHATKCMARELAKKNIRVNSISPGFLETDFNRDAREMNLETWNKRIAKVPLGGRPGTPGDIAGAALYLASDAASYVTGIDILVDGGYLT